MSDKLQTNWIKCLTCDGHGTLPLGNGSREACHDCCAAGGHAEIEEAPAVPSGFAKGLSMIAASILF